MTDEFEAIIAQIKRRHVAAVWSILSQHVGHESALKRPELLRRVRLATRSARFADRVLRKILQNIRDAGIPVCSDREGYWIGTPTETLEWAKWYRRHAFSMLSTAGVLIRGAMHLLDDGGARAEAEAIAESIQLSLELIEEKP